MYSVAYNSCKTMLTDVKNDVVAFIIMKPHRKPYFVTE